MAFIPIYILILFFTILIDYVAGILIEKSTTHKKLLLICSLVSNIGVLAVFKYYNFFTENINWLLTSWENSKPLPYLTIILPIGLSFHTFQAMSYTIEIYRGNQKAERHLGIYALYVMFYPQLVAGPIERPQNLIHQFREKHRFDYDRVTSGLKLMAWGFFKKIVIADRLDILVNTFYSDPLSHQDLTLFAILFFSIQIYCDFSGYSDIAIGCARVLGIQLMKNFNRPNFSKSIAEFWRRWHISLSTWFKDYVYIPLKGNKKNRLHWAFSILIVFLLSGLWHGANWTFIIWGGLHGLFIILEFLIKKYIKIKLPDVLSLFITFSIVCLTRIFFRAPTLKDAINVVNQLKDIVILKTQIRSLNYDQTYLLIDILLILFLFLVEYIQGYKSIPTWISKQPIVVRFTIYTLGIVSIFLLGNFNSQRQFIYFQF